MSVKMKVLSSSLGLLSPTATPGSAGRPFPLEFGVSLPLNYDSAAISRLET